ncbi:MAG: hypothetical protein DRN88_00275 [Candidatus Hydrothermarchaeota archaeon]|nr:MAG: hypothetical protein DRN88_00275 [Candidatus Hydrothermarchaeota archaeon]
MGDLMFKPVRMKKVTAILLEDSKEAVLRELKEYGIIQLKQVQEELGVSPVPFSKYRSRVLELLSRVETILETFSLVEDKKKPLLTSITEEEAKKKPVFEKSIEEFLKETEEFFLPIENEVKKISSRLDEIKKEKEELKNINEILSLLKHIGIDPKSLTGYKKTGVILGLASQKEFEEIKSELECFIYTKELDKKRLIVLLVYDKEIENEVTRILRLHRFEEISIPEEYSSLSLEEAFEKVETSLTELEKEEKELIQKLIKLSEDKEELLRIRELLLIEKTLDEANLNIGKTKKTCILSGWIPEYEVEKAKEIIARASQNLCIINIEDAKEEEKPPTLLKNPPPARPFEVLTKTYGNPSYNEIDPTSVIALTFPLVYGFMFGDVGHGLVLAILGGILKFKIKANQIIKRFGGMLLACGIFSMFAGLLYGSILGIEELFHPLLGKPPIENVSFLIKFSLYLGVALLTLGCILNIINKIHHHEKLVAIFSPWGVMGLWVLLGGTYLIARNNADIFSIKSDPLLLPLVVLPLLAIMFGMVYAEKISIGWGFYEAFEAATRFLFNVISYVRVAVIGVVHSALCLLMVMAIEAMPHSIVGYIGKAIVFILGNLIIIVFEGLISFIQTLRLHYYEFFSKFFEAKGEEFKPFKVNRKYTIKK